MFLWLNPVVNLLLLHASSPGVSRGRKSNGVRRWRRFAREACKRQQCKPRTSPPGLRLQPGPPQLPHPASQQMAPSCTPTTSLHLPCAQLKHGSHRASLWSCFVVVKVQVWSEAKAHASCAWQVGVVPAGNRLCRIHASVWVWCHITCDGSNIPERVGLFALVRETDLQ